MMKIDRELEQMLKKAEKPARYTGGEINMVRKDLDLPFRICMR